MKINDNSDLRKKIENTKVRVIDSVGANIGEKRKGDLLTVKSSELDAATLEQEDHPSIARELIVDDEKSMTPPCRKNAFRELLQSSKKLFQEEEISKHHFYLFEQDNGEFSLTWMSQDNKFSKRLTETKWSETIILHASEEEKKQGINKISITLETSIPSEEPFRQPIYVQKHSKLSVPVLKSVLQKSIRRRRPMPSVRIAMELVDKAFSELLRRLPIIILEDAFLHNGFPFLVWLMAAVSKVCAARNIKLLCFTLT